MRGSTPQPTHRRLKAVALLVSLLFMSLGPLIAPAPLGEHQFVATTSDQSVWFGTEQPWPQFAKFPTHNQTLPQHGPDGGPGAGNVSDVTVLATLDSPVINWQAFDSGEGADGYGSVIGDFSSSIDAVEAAVERCGQGTLFPVMINSEITDGNRESYLNIISGNDAKVAWRVSLGITESIRATPIIHDINQDGFPEIIVVYDTQGALNIDVWSPRLTCTESNWQTSGHANELLWSYSDADVRIGSPSPHWPTANSDHKAVTQPLLADLELDGTPELVLALVDDPEDNPSVTLQSFTLTNAQPSEADWSVTLDRGTHPSDPVWAQLDDSTGALLLTTIDANTGNMWIWKIDGGTGSIDWERVAVPGTDSDSDAPRLRLPGPIVVQLDADAAPEMILTVPTDPNGRTSGTGARYIGMEITSTNEIFNFRAPNGYADTQPIAADTDDDGVHDRLCWATWYSESSINFNRMGLVGCTDISDENPVNEWTRNLQRGSGNDNDEIAVSPPMLMDIDGEGTDEVVIGFGRRLWAFDGDTGASADINTAWSSPLNMPHRVWAAGAAADVDGDGHLDVLIGDTLVSNQGADFAPSYDNRGLSFNPASADPGDTVTVTGQFSNIGTASPDDDLDAVILMNGVELKRERFTNLDPVSPSGEGGPQTFTAEFVAQLGMHTFELRLDINDNITEQREDNNHATTTYEVVEPYLAQISGPLETPRIVPGTSQALDIVVTSVGSRTGDWTLVHDTSALPAGWSFSPSSGQSSTVELVPNTPQILSFDISAPSSALGDESGVIEFVLSLDQDPSVNVTLEVPVEVFRTRGLDLSGSSGLNQSNGQGRPGLTARSWFMVENLGNAAETTTSITWSAPSWGGSPSIHDLDGTQLFSLTLQPGQRMELEAHLPTPSSASYGSTTQTTLTMCMGSGEDALCESMPFTFTAQAFVVLPAHRRSLPNATLTWTLEGTLPSTGMVQWNTVEMGMALSTWQWSTTGDWSMNGSYIEHQGVPGSLVSGEMVLELPPNAVPNRHTFTGVDVSEDDAVLNFSLHVLQIYRAHLELIEPQPLEVGQPLSLNVTEQHSFLLFVSNPGNGQDTFTLSATASSTGSENPPLVDFTFYDPVKTMGALSTGIGTVDVVLSEDMPAQSPFEITFTWRSAGNTSVLSQVNIMVQAAPSHEWSVSPANGSALYGAPGDHIEAILNLTNLGNAQDSLLLDPSWLVQTDDGDLSLWSISAVQSPMLDINASTTVNVSIMVPNDAWAGALLTLKLAHVTNGYVLGESELTVEVLPVSGWRLNLTGADLEVDPSGELLVFELVHTGNAHETPYFAKADAGWNITLPDFGEEVEPYGTGILEVFVQPPSDALAGEVGVLRIRITGNDTSGLVIEEIPVRVGAEPNMSVDHRGQWAVNEKGGFPAAWIENSGNDIALLSIDIDGLPEGWTTQQGVSMVLAPGEISGLPIELHPASDWNQQRFLVTINVHHPLLNTVSHDIEVAYSQISFATSPVYDDFAGSQQSVRLHSSGTGSIVLQSEAFAWEGTSVSSSDGVLAFLQPTNTGSVNIAFEQDAINGTLTAYVFSRSYPDASAQCQWFDDVWSNLGRETTSGDIATCTLVAGGDEDLRAIATMVTNRGERVNLDEELWQVPAGTEVSFNLSVVDWDPAPGVFLIEITFHDQFGRELEQLKDSVVAREQGWNIGVNTLSTDGIITVGIQRTGYSVLEHAVCELLIEADGGWSSRSIVDIAGADFAPVVSVANPGTIKNDEEITATVSCTVPFDVDDNPEDDTKRAYYEAESLLTVTSSDVGLIIGISLAIVTIAWFAGAIRPKQTTQRNRTTSKEEKPVQERPSNTPEGPTSVPTVNEEDDLHVVVDPIDEVNEERAEMEEAEDEHQKEDNTLDLVEVIEVSQEEVASDDTRSASGRLASLREEIGEGDGAKPDGNIEDRMKNFFGKF